jgi:hypothetical protein
LLIVPVLTWLAVMPFVLAEPLEWYLLPWWVGAVCAPGVIDAWRGVPSVSRARHQWRVACLGVATLASFVGSVFGAFTIVFGALGLASSVCLVLLLVRARRAMAGQ